ncbi:S-glutathionyl-(chloro)hydroquinone reductase [Mycoemilia scoparia]|uniref:S-glutathionyl-(Chloro)hydroquinone reductase n=1 Tax=Mycoemilia scoparia TaxID=417184 RepID=A0A9W8A3R1_9FUNG|nr:S-glutathionyl-(chloro)hydroquinone reductase [Mycoemilia scoparia]
MSKQVGKAIKGWASADGEFRRQVSSFRDWISSDPSSKFQPEKGRYHLYVSLACPWAHRTLIARSIKGLKDVIGISVVDQFLGEGGWKFSDPKDCPGAIPDTVNDSKFLSELYFKAEPNYNARFTVPVLWDKKNKTIVNNESSEILRILNEGFNDIIEPEYQKIDLYPKNLRKEIDDINEWIYNDINNGVYKSGFATDQKVYENHVTKLFESLDRVEKILSDKQFLVGNVLTEADIRLWTTIVRFDPVYHGHFKCNLKLIAHDYPSILRWARLVYQLPGVKETVDMDHIKYHYYTSHTNINPTQIVPVSNGPDLENPVVKPEGDYLTRS